MSTQSWLGCWLKRSRSLRTCDPVEQKKIGRGETRFIFLLIIIESPLPLVAFHYLFFMHTWLGLFLPLLWVMNSHFLNWDGDGCSWKKRVHIYHSALYSFFSSSSFNHPWCYSMSTTCTLTQKSRIDNNDCGPINALQTRSSSREEEDSTELYESVLLECIEFSSTRQKDVLKEYK